MNYSFIVASIVTKLWGLNRIESFRIWHKAYTRCSSSPETDGISRIHNQTSWAPRTNLWCQKIVCVFRVVAAGALYCSFEEQGLLFENISHLSSPPQHACADKKCGNRPQSQFTVVVWTSICMHTANFTLGPAVEYWTVYNVSTYYLCYGTLSLPASTWQRIVLAAGKIRESDELNSDLMSEKYLNQDMLQALIV